MSRLKICLYMFSLVLAIFLMVMFVEQKDDVEVESQYYTKEEIDEMFNDKTNICNYDYVIRTEVVEEVSRYKYIVSRERYDIIDTYEIYTMQDLSIGDVVQLAMYRDGTIELFVELICEVRSD